MTLLPDFRPRAKLDLRDRVEYFSTISLDLTVRFINATEETVAFLRRNPHVGQRWQGNVLQPTEYRIWMVKDFPNYVILFQPTEAGIDVLRVLLPKT